MSACLPIKWLPDSLPGRVEASVREMLARWAADWGAPPATAVTARLLAAHATPLARPLPWGDLPKPWAGALVRALLGPAASASPIGQEAMRRATADLQDTLRRRFCMQPSATAFIPARIGHGGVDVGFELLDMPFGFTLDLQALQAGGWLAVVTPSPLPAIAIERSLHDMPVPLVAQVGRASVSAADIMQLRPGDVLLLAETLDAPLQVTSPGSSLQLAAHLGATTAPARRAVRWLSS